MSYRMLSSLFNIGKTGRRRAISTARKELSLNFTPKYVGFQHISRQDIKDDHTRPLAKELFGNEIENPVILVADGTYIYIKKSNNFKFQRRSYSLHKNRPLVKPMIIVSTTGYIVSVLGPYHADCKNNDAKIIKHNSKLNMEQMTVWISEGDFLLVDRGFRDAVDFLEEMGVHSKMHSFHKKGQKQHTVEEIILVGDPGSEDLTALIDCLNSQFIPNKVLIINNGQNDSFLKSKLDILQTLTKKDGKATAYVCENYTCSLPVTSPEQLLKLIS